MSEFPIRCFTCGKEINSYYSTYLAIVNKNKNIKESPKVTYLTNDNMEKTDCAKALDELEIVKPCCRRHFLTHVQLDP